MIDLFGILGIVVILIAINGLFVAAEFALVTVPRVSVSNSAAKGRPMARLVARILRDPQRQDRYIATAQLGITFASLGLGMYGEHALAEWLELTLGETGPLTWIATYGLASILAIVVLTYFHIVMGEMVPKALAIQAPERTSYVVTPFMMGAKVLFYPLMWVLNTIATRLLALVGVHRQAAVHSHYHTPEELQYLVEESQAGGMLKPEAARVVSELFEFGEITAGEVMVPRVKMVGIRSDMDRHEIADVIRQTRHTRYPVFDGDLDHILGIVHIKDLLRHMMNGDELGRTRLRRVPFVPTTLELDEVLVAMREAHTHVAIVMDEHGGTAGIVTMEDLFAEVVGEIGMNSAGEQEIEAEAGGSLRVAGTARIDEVGESLELPLEHEEVDTVSGLVLDSLGRPPRIGDQVEFEGIRFEVIAVEGNGVRTCRVTRNHAGDEE